MDKKKIANLLITPSALVALSMDDALLLTSYMLLARFEQGSIIFHASKQDIGSEHMLLILDGDVLIETHSNGDATTVVSILSAGHLIGEMSLIDGEPRSATCTAQTVVDVAMLSRRDLERLMLEHPSIAARFCLAMAKKLADHVRLGNQKLLMMSQVNDAMRLEIDAQIRKKSHRYAPIS